MKTNNRLLVYLSEQNLKKLNVNSAQQGISKSSLVNVLIAKYLKNETSNKEQSTNMKAKDGVSYIVPQVIHYDNLEDKTEFLYAI